MRIERLKQVLVAVCGMAIGVTSAASVGQPAGGAGAVAPRPSDADALSAPRAAREIARMAALDLQITGGGSPRDFRIAALLLSIAHELAPKDENILRLAIDAASSSGDRESLTRLTKDLVLLNSSDTVAQLRLIAGAINAKQDVEARLGAYDFWLAYKDQKGNALDASIRSRLALDAALLLRERGDMRGFADKLALATELDLTNKDAASLALTFYTDNSGDAMGRLALLINLLKADPFDPAIHLAMARELAAGDAVVQATRFYQTHTALMELRGETVSSAITAESNVLYWAADGAEQLIRRMREEVERRRSEVQQMRRRAIEQDRPLAELPDPERVRLSPELERVRLAASVATGDEAAGDYAYAELLRTFELQLTLAEDRSNLPEGTKEQDVLDAVRRLRGELMWMRLWSGRQVPEAETVLNEFKLEPEVIGSPEAMAVVQRLEGWLQLQKGELDAAEKTLTPVAETDVLARLGLCMVKERRGPKEEAIKAYESLARDSAGSVVGAAARTRYGVLAGKSLERAPGAKDLESLAAGVPEWLEAMIADPRRIASLQATLAPDRIGALDPARVRVRLRNVSPIPLAVGPEKPINSRILLVPRIEAGLDQVRASAGAVVVRLDRKLRLLPQEEIDVTAWADQGNMGWIMNRLVTAPLTIKWKVIQGFTLHPQGVYIQGPHCLAVETVQLQKQPSAKAYDEGPVVVKWMESGSSEDIAEVIMLAQVNAQVKPDARGAWPQDQRDAIGAALAARYPKLDAAARMMVAAMLPLPSQAAWFKAAEDAIAADPDPRVQMVALALRVADAKDPRVAAGQSSGDARLAEVAELVRGRLEAGTPTYSTLIEKDAEAPAEGEAKAPTGGQP